MKILQIIPGSGGSFYCGNCLRDITYYDALKKLGHDVIKIPMYLPLFADEHDIKDVPVFYGAVSIYLKHAYPVFKKAPAWFDNFLNSKPVLKLAANMSGSTRATGLEDMTISMLLGEEGKQKEELERMVDWIETHFQPDVIHLSNALLLGLAYKLKERIKAPVFCSLQDEDVWVDAMEQPFRNRVWNLMSEKGNGIDGFVSVSNYYAEVSKSKMTLPEDRVHSVHLGIDPENYAFKNAAEKNRNIGFISRMCHSNGLDILVDAFIMVKNNPGYEDVKLIVTGGNTGDDHSYIRSIKRKLKKAGLTNHVEFQKDFEGQPRMDYFEKVSIISVPVRKGEAFGIYLIEALASGIPVVQPNLGAFPEIVKKSGGGVIYEKNTPVQLAASLQKLLDDKKLLGELSKKARDSAETSFNVNQLAADLIEIYKSAKPEIHVTVS
jgi:glycosyltransferase involved in cell wall biosynthesis